MPLTAERRERLNRLAAGYQAARARDDGEFDLDSPERREVRQRIRGSAVDEGTFGNVTSVFGDEFRRDLERNGLGMSPEFYERYLRRFVGNEADPLPQRMLGSLNAALIDVVMEAPVQFFDVSRAAYRGSLAAIGQTAMEAGASRTQARRLVRDLDLIDQVTAPQLATFPGSFSGALRLRQTERATRANMRRMEKAGQLIMDADEATDEAMRQLKQKAGLMGATARQRGRQSRFSFTQRLKTQAVDRFHPARIIEQEARRQGVIPQDLSPYRDLRLLSGTDGVFEAVLRKGTIKRLPDGNIAFNGEGLEDVFGEVGDRIDDTMLYFIGKSAQDRKLLGKERFFSDDEIAAMIRVGDEDPAILDAHRRWLEFNDRMLDFAVQSEILAPEKKALFQELHKNHVPFYRIVEDIDGAERVRGSLFRRAKGGTAQLNDMFENIYKNTHMLLNASLVNNAKRNLYQVIGDLELDQVDGIVKKRKKIPAQAAVAEDKIRSILEDAMEAGVKLDPDDIRVWTYNGFVPEGVDRVFVGGKAVDYDILDPTMRKMLESLGPRNASLLTQTFQVPKTVLTTAVTKMPTFVVRNAIRDTVTAFVQTEKTGLPNPFTHVADAARGFISAYKQNDAYWTAMANGLGDLSLSAAERVLNVRRDLYARHGIDYQRQIFDTPRKLLDGINRGFTAVEMGNRLSEFRRIADKAGDFRAAALAARDVSTDFTRHGANQFFTNFISTVPFFNARLQGLATGVEKFKRRPFTLGTRAFLSTTLPTASLYLAFRDDPRWEQLPQWFKDTHFPFFLPGHDDLYFGVPNGFEYGAIFGAMPLRMMESIEQRNGRLFAKHFARILTENLSFNPLPAALKPLVELDRNRSFFNDARIISPDLEKVQPIEQFKPWTSETLVLMAQALEEHTGIQVSPAQVEHLLRGYIGSFSTLFLHHTTDSLARDELGWGDEPTERLDTIPLVKAFVRELPARGGPFEEDFYDAVTLTRELSATVAKARREGRSPEFRDREDLIRISVAPALDKYSRQMSLLRRQLTQISLSPNMSQDQKDELTDEIENAMNRLATSVVKGLKDDDEIMEALFPQDVQTILGLK